MKQALLIFLFMVSAKVLFAQRFEVQSFRLLENDITAWMNPVRDLNHEACALLKIVCTPEFAFSTPLGIVQRKEQVGEVWIYVPNGTIQLTIKHPRWGVLRDYPFPEALESRLSYELVLLPPPPEETAADIPLQIRHLPSKLQNTLDEPSIRIPGSIRLRKKSPRYLAMIHAGMAQKRLSSGLTLGFVKKHGAFVHVQSDFHALSPQGECNRDGIESVSGQTPWYTGHTLQSRYFFTAGALHRIAGLFYLYEGIGYGKRTVCWETLEGLILKNTDDSVQGITGEAGGLILINRFVLSAGVATIQGKLWEPVIGLGIHF